MKAWDNIIGNLSYISLTERIITLKIIYLPIFSFTDAVLAKTGSTKVLFNIDEPWNENLFHEVDRFNVNREAHIFPNPEYTNICDAP